MSPASLTTSRASRALETGEAKLWVLLVGVNQYQDDRLPTLAYSALDCQGLGDAIAIATQAFPKKTVMLHHDFAGTQARPVGVQASLPNQIATMGRLSLKTVAQYRSFPAQFPQLSLVQASLKRIVTEAKPQDTVLFYFSGHGVLEPTTQQAVLCLAETDKDRLLETGLGVQTLLQQLATCAAHQQLVWLDACHSGGMSFRVAKGEAEEKLPNPTLQLVEVLRQRAAQSKGFYALLSCDQTQQSWEFPELGHGVFTYYLMRGLLGEAADAQGVIEADTLYKYVYYQTLRYIDKTNQQLRLINQQKRGRGETQLQPEYPQQTPKRIVEGVGELILGLRPAQPELRHPRQALVVDGLASSATSLSLSKLLRGNGRFELNFWPQPSQTDLRQSIQACLQMGEAALTESATALIYLRGRVEQTETGDDRLIVRDEVEISRSWLRQALRHAQVSRQVVILDCPGAVSLSEWVEDLQLGPDRGQCLMAAASPEECPEQFAQILLDTLAAADPQVGLPIAGWIAQIQLQLSETAMTPYIWLSGSQGVIEVFPGQVGGQDKAADAFDLGLCPYQGLRAFGEADMAFFFGREALTRQMVNLLNQQSFLAVVGASGSGKSSVVQAGVMAQLRQGKLIPDSDRWWIRSLRPGHHPLEALVQRLVDSGTEKEQTYQRLQLEGLLYQGPEGFVRWLRSRPEPVVVLVIDQFEELFTLATVEERQRFLELVLSAVEHAGDRFKLIITLRTDFVAPCLELSALAPLLQQFNVLVPPTLSEADYRQIILKPAEKVGLAIEPELIEVLLQELGHGTGDLPLLEFVLEQLWEHRQPGQLTLAVYQQQIGGLRGALEQKAQSLYDSLNVEAQACARWIFLSLTQLGEGSEDTRRRIVKSDLVVAKYSEALVEQTLQALIAAKLIVASLEDADWMAPISQSRSAAEDAPILDESASLPTVPPSPTIEIAHEILIRHWSTLRWWLEENRTRLRSQRQIEQSAQQWRQSGSQPDFLLQGVRLDAAEELYVKYTDELSQDVQEFIEAGLQERERQQQQLKQRLKRAQMAIALIGSLGLAATGLGGVAYFQQQQVRLNEIAALNALSEAQLLAHQPIESLLTGLKSGQQFRALGWGGGSHRSMLQVQTLGTLQQAIALTQESNRLEGHSQSVNAVSVSPDGQWIASGSEDATIRLWSTDGTLIHRLEAPERVTDLAFGPEGSTLAAVTAAGELLLWNLQEGNPHEGQLERTFNHGDWITAVAVSPANGAIATAGRDQTIKLWDTQNGSQLRTLTGHQGWVNQVSFSPDGQTLASVGEDRTIRLWNLADGSFRQTLTGHGDRVTSVEFSPNGQTLASTSADGTVKLWNLSDGSVQTLEGHQGQVNAVAFSPDGETLVSAGADGTLKHWQIDDGALLETLRGHGGTVLKVRFSPSGQTLISAGTDKSIRIWQIRPPVLDTAGAMSASFSPDSQTFAVANWNGEVQLWRRDRDALGLLLKTLEGEGMPSLVVQFSPDGRTVAAADAEQNIRVWEVASGRVTQTLSGHDAVITSLRFSPDGQMLASGSDDRTVRLWNVTSGALVQTLNHEDGVTSVVWHPDGKTLAAGSYDSTVNLWRIQDGTLLRSLEGHGLAIADLAFSPNGKTLATGSYDNMAQLWRVRDGHLLYRLAGHQDGVTSVAFSPDGRFLATGSADQTLKFWNPANGSLIKTLRGSQDAVRNLSFSQDGTTLISTSEAAGILFWNLDFNGLMQAGCDRLQDYLFTNVNVVAGDRTLCN